MRLKLLAAVIALAPARLLACSESDGFTESDRIFAARLCDAIAIVKSVTAQPTTTAPDGTPVPPPADTYEVRITAAVPVAKRWMTNRGKDEIEQLMSLIMDAIHRRDGSKTKAVVSMTSDRKGDVARVIGTRAYDSGRPPAFIYRAGWDLLPLAALPTPSPTPTCACACPSR